MLFDVKDEIKEETQEIRLNNFVRTHMCTSHGPLLCNDCEMDGYT
jgi:hypothetical protein